MEGGRVRLLFVGDIHLGRRPTRLPDALAEHGIEPGELTPAAAWARTVERARDAAVDAVVLAGDVVESVDDVFEAYGPLQRGVERLVAAGIPVYGVAGNHDGEALPRLAARVEGFHLLGAGGRWERVEVPGREGGCVELLGWSFPQRVVRRSPLETLEGEDRAERPVLGVLHCDLDKRASGYAPVPRSALEATGAAAWMLGHVHAPGELSGERPIGYLGSLCGLDPGEPGPHGPWLVEVAGEGALRAEQLPLAPLRYEREEIDAGALDAASDAALEEQLFDAAVGALARAHARIGAAAEGSRAVLCRLRLVGRSVRHAALARLRERAAGLAAWHEGVAYFVERVEDRAEPALDLAALAESDDPPGLLARRLRALRAGDPEAEALVREALEAISAERGAATWRAAAGGDPEPEEVRDALLRAGTQALEELMEQRASAEKEGP